MVILRYNNEHNALSNIGSFKLEEAQDQERAESCASRKCIFHVNLRMNIKTSLAKKPRFSPMLEGIETNSDIAISSLNSRKKFSEVEVWEKIMNEKRISGDHGADGRTIWRMIQGIRGIRGIRFGLLDLKRSLSDSYLHKKRREKSLILITMTIRLHRLFLH